MDKDIVDWDELSAEEQAKAQKYLDELDILFDKFTGREDKCENSTSND